MFQNEITKKRKAEAAVAVEAPKGLFVVASTIAGAADDGGEQERVVPGWESWEF